MDRPAHLDTPRNRKRLVTGARTLAGTLLLALACTLTRDDFSPTAPEIEQDPNPALPDAGSGSGGTGSDVLECTAERGCCEADGDCAEGDACVAGVCEQVTCTGTEDVSSCPLPLCPGPNCPTPPVPAACNDEIQNGSEAGVDCGRACPERCPTDTPCEVNLDCASLNCVEGACAEATCSDGITNRDESDVDCGGSCEARCAAGDNCRADSDCGPDFFCPNATRVCTNNSCQDGLQSGSEIETDCGGGECPGCDAGTPCNTDADCESRLCGADDLCTAANCDDGRRNQDETGVDCGGSCPDECPDGSECTEESDCESGVCEAGGCEPEFDLCCQEPSCFDGVENGNEPSVDCGSVQVCGLCAIGRPCSANNQCQTGICDDTCQPRPICDDGVVSGTETDVDCGGPAAACDRCPDGDDCDVDSDCASRNCESGTCISCNDDEENGLETGEDCGGTGSGCPRCPVGQGCAAGSDCQSGFCAPNQTCANISCDDNLRNGTETDTDCGGANQCDRCPDGDVCVVNSDCASNSCANGRCISCDDNQRNGTETDTDCGGASAACARCQPGQLCSADSDCSRNACVNGRCCGGTTGDCTRCAERLSLTLNCNSAGIDQTGITFCTGFLGCLAQNQPVCATRNSPGCSALNTDACDHNDFGGDGGTGVSRANQVLLNAGCQLSP